MDGSGQNMLLCSALLYTICFLINLPLLYWMNLSIWPVKESWELNYCTYNLAISKYVASATAHIRNRSYCTMRFSPHYCTISGQNSCARKWASAKFTVCKRVSILLACALSAFDQSPSMHRWDAHLTQTCTVLCRIQGRSVGFPTGEHSWRSRDDDTLDAGRFVIKT